MTDWNPDNPADLGVWEELEWTQPLPAKKKSLSLTLKKRCRKSPDPERFHSPGKSLDKYQEQYIPENTKVNTRWRSRISKPGRLATILCVMKKSVKMVFCCLMILRSFPFGCKSMLYIRRSSLVSLIRLRTIHLLLSHLQKTILIYPFCIRMCRCHISTINSSNNQHSGAVLMGHNSDDLNCITLY